MSEMGESGTGLLGVSGTRVDMLGLLGARIGAGAAELPPNQIVEQNKYTQ